MYLIKIMLNNIFVKYNKVYIYLNLNSKINSYSQKILSNKKILFLNIEE